MIWHTSCLSEQCKLQQDVTLDMPSPTIIECRSMSEFSPLIDRQTWVLLDLDNTVFQSSTPYGHVGWLDDLVADLMSQGLSREESFHSIFPRWKQAQQEISVVSLEPAMISAIHRLQEEGITIMGVTHRESFLVDRTLELLRGLELDFGRTAPVEKAFEFQAVERVVYDHGILFVHTFNDKGEVFLLFLDKIGKRPEKMLFVDDKKKNVEQMVRMGVSAHIPIIGVHYTAIEHGPKIYQPGAVPPCHSSVDQPLYLILSMEDWRKSLHSDHLAAAPHVLFEIEQQQAAAASLEDYIVLKILLSDWVVPEELEQSNKRILYRGKIPLSAVVEARVNRSFQSSI